MFFQINGLSIGNLQKAQDGKKIVVDIIANHLTEDSDGETVLKEAFSPETVKEFLDIGVIEFWHESRNPIRTKEEKMEMLLGRPIDFRWEGGLPVVRAELTAEHPIVKQMIPHLEADNPVYAASIGGKKMVLEARDAKGQIKKIIPKMMFDHLAIAPCNNVINREAGTNVRMVQMNKANEVFVEFGSMQSFKTESMEIFGKEEELKKALLAPESVSDLYSAPGGVITKQSLEKSINDFSFNESDVMKLIDFFITMNKDMPRNRAAFFRIYKNDPEFAEKAYRLLRKYFANSKKGD